MLKASPKVVGYLWRIIAEMVDRFGITEDEAVGRMNQAWAAQKFDDDGDWLFHKNEEYWAVNIYYGPDGNWLPKDQLRPLPYP
ncbi:MAG TPA: hypothetical protein VFC19_48075 [Candidatus Limnocylindrales bacterium]|nr:hypothetical protein [Candidatus Limnocylindrales bacterium]